MNTRSSSDKGEVNNLYKVAIENRGKPKRDSYTIHTSTPQSSNSTHTPIDLSLDDSETEEDLFRTLTNTLVSDTSGDITIRRSTILFRMRFGFRISPNKNGSCGQP